MNNETKQKAIFLDRDGTINIDKHYVYKIDEFEFLPGVIEGLKLLQEAGYLLIVITNQSGIARGYYTEEKYHQLNEYMLCQLEKQGVHITDMFYCPHHPEGVVKKFSFDCDCRKPKLGLFYAAQKKWNVDWDQSYAIGDKLRDIAICKITNCKGYLLVSDSDATILHSRIKVKNSLYEVAKDIVGDNEVD